MRSATLGVLLVTGLVAVAALVTSGGSRALAERAGSYQLGDDSLIAIPMPAGEGYQQLAVIDPKLKSMSVYHIDLTTGVISLKSVRNLHWDLQLIEYNGATPLPRELRTQFEQ